MPKIICRCLFNFMCVPLCHVRFQCPKKPARMQIGQRPQEPVRLAKTAQKEATGGEGPGEAAAAVSAHQLARNLLNKYNGKDDWEQHATVVATRFSTVCACDCCCEMAPGTQNCACLAA